MKAILSKFTGDEVDARARRSLIWTVVDFGGGNALRLVSNLILTRLLFPEAFGVMALVAVVMAGLALFTDTGVGPSIIQSERGDDPAFLNTAWTFQVLRGLIMWLAILVVAIPIGNLYEEPQLAQILPVAGLGLLIDSFKPIAVYTVNRHLAIGKFIRIKLGAQVVNLLILVALAWQLQSVWALVIGAVIGTCIETTAYHAFLQGPKNRFRFERDAARELFHFGKWIFISTAATFLISQGDRAILGLYVPLETLGIYNIGYFLASVPLMLSTALHQTVMMPLYRLKAANDDGSNLTELFQTRRLIAVAMLLMVALLGFIGPSLVSFLYDPRYANAGTMITVLAVAIVPIISLSTTNAALVGLGDSRAMFLITSTTAVLQTALLIVGIPRFGVVGALLAPSLAIIISYPLRLFYSKKYHVFDPVQDFAITVAGLALPIAACMLHWDKITMLLR